MKPFLKIDSLVSLYDQRTTAGISGISFELSPKECLGVIGPSGSGKSTLLKCIAGIIKDFKGDIRQSEDVVIGHVAQDESLDPELTIFENLSREIEQVNDPEKIANQVRSTLSILEITNEIDSYPKEISGGQYQRAIIGKALVRNPSLMLLDEPFGHLDERLRFELMTELFPLFKSQGIALIWVTHQNHEALAFSDRILVLNHGEVQAIDRPYELVYKPKNLFTAQFMGRSNTVVAKLIEDQGERLLINLFGKKIDIKKPEAFLPPEFEEILLILRSDQVMKDDKGEFKGKIVEALFLGERYLCEVEVNLETSLWMNVPGHERPQKNQEIRFEIDRERLHSLSEV